MAQPTDSIEPTCSQSTRKIQLEKENSSSQATSKNMFDNMKKVQFEFFLMTAGLLSTGSDLKHRFGPIKRDKPTNRLQSMYCHVICSMFWLFTLRQFILMFISDSYVQVMLGDITGYWNSYRMYYLLPSFLLSLQAALCCTFFMSNENELNWIVPFLSIQQKKYKNPRFTMDHSMHNVRINISIFLVLCIAFGSSAFVSYETFRTAYENFSEETFLIWIPWWVVSLVVFFGSLFRSYQVDLSHRRIPSPL